MIVSRLSLREEIWPRRKKEEGRRKKGLRRLRRTASRGKKGEGKEPKPGKKN